MNIKKATEQSSHADQDLLADTLEQLAAVLRSGACHATHAQLASMCDLISRFTSPANILTAYQVCNELGGITSRTLYNYVDIGLVPRPHQLAGAGNTNFWYTDEIAEAKEKIKKYKDI